MRSAEQMHEQLKRANQKREASLLRRAAHWADAACTADVTCHAKDGRALLNVTVRSRQATARLQLVEMTVQLRKLAEVLEDELHSTPPT